MTTKLPVQHNFHKHNHAFDNCPDLIDIGKSGMEDK